MGKGAAVRRDMAEARGAFRISMDSDLPFELDVIERMLHYLDFKEFQVVVGSRAAGGASYALARPTSRQLASVVFTELVGRMVVTGVRDTQRASRDSAPTSPTGCSARRASIASRSTWSCCISRSRTTST
jgi:hypothetical protein